MLFGILFLVMTSKILQEKFEGHLMRKQKMDFILHNVFLFKRESDVLAVKDGIIHEYEFKIGSADFAKDIKKARHVEGGIPHFFCYVVSDVSVIKGDYLNYAGIYLHSFQKDGFSSFKLIKAPLCIRDEEITKRELYSLLKKAYNGKKI